jgi:hypothetical protein
MLVIRDFYSRHFLGVYRVHIIALWPLRAVAAFAAYALVMAFSYSARATAPRLYAPMGEYP